MGERVSLPEGSNQHHTRRGGQHDAPPRSGLIDRRATDAPARIEDPERRGKEREAIGVFVCRAQLTVHGVHGALALYSESHRCVRAKAAANCTSESTTPHSRATPRLFSNSYPKARI